MLCYLCFNWPSTADGMQAVFVDLLTFKESASVKLDVEYASLLNVGTSPDLLGETLTG